MLRPRLAALLLPVLVALLPSGLSQAEEPAYRIVRPSDKAHELLPKTCGVCHKDGPLHFFVVTAQDADALTRALERLQASAEAPAVARPANPHAAIACLFCHMEPPAAEGRTAGMQFRTIEGLGVPAVEVERHCALCHPEGSDSHPRVLGAGAEAALGLREAGLPLQAGQPVCSTCHEMHGEEVGPVDVRTGYLDFSARSRASYPHGNRAGCGACHPGLPPAGDPSFVAPDPTALCTRCHGEEHRVHPVGGKPSSRTYPMDFLGYPLDPEGRATCVTCHDHPCLERPEPRNPRFLRGGPYPAITDFCYRCHPKAGGNALSPHRQVDRQGRVLTSTCQLCHRVVPEDLEGAGFRMEDLLYLRTPVELCTGCHEARPHPAANHLVRMPEAMIGRLRRYEERHRQELPLGPENEVVCTTCHNPHDKGVLRGRAALGAGEENRWRVPSFAELCAPCHERHE